MCPKWPGQCCVVRPHVAQLHHKNEEKKKTKKKRQFRVVRGAGMHAGIRSGQSRIQYIADWDALNALNALHSLQGRRAQVSLYLFDSHRIYSSHREKDAPCEIVHRSESRVVRPAAGRPPEVVEDYRAGNLRN